ncbi:MAG TPA: amino acid ABC transporter permease [Hyphomicrobiales bacterium]|nr:amino acid ABC transporter permease [Hyphomicrobiales bacterium]
MSSAIDRQRLRSVFIEAALVIAVVAVLVWIGTNTAANLQRAHIASGFGFLGQRAGFEIAQSLIPFSPDRSYGYALLAGLANTLLVAVLGILLASAIGFVVGVARLSRNWLVRTLAAVYVEIFRNIPPLLVIFFWYFGVLAVLPPPRQALDLGLGFSVSNRGLYAPEPVAGHGMIAVGLVFVFAVAAAVALARWAHARSEHTGRGFPGAVVGLVLVIVATGLAFVAAGMPLHLALPQRTRFNLIGGLQLQPEFVALLFALSIFTAAFIAEIVRSGVLAVGRGQTEAAYSLGLKPGPTLRLVVLPQALRVIIPPLTSEYLNLTKNTSLAVAVGFSELVAVGGQILNQTGQAIEVVVIWMAVYLGISLLTSFAMNRFNRRIALVER